MSPFAYQVLQGHESEILSVAFSRGCHALTGTRDGAIGLWDLTQSPIRGQMCKMHSRPVTAIAFRTSQTALTGCDDGTVGFLNLSGLDRLERIPQTTAMRSLATSPDGRFIIKAYKHTSAQIYDITGPQDQIGLTDLFLLLKMTIDQASLENDPQALTRLKALKTELLLSHQAEAYTINKFLAAKRLPQSTCSACTRSYGISHHVCEQLPCCKSFIGSRCVHLLLNPDPAQSLEIGDSKSQRKFVMGMRGSCFSCNKPAQQIGSIVDVLDQNNPRCAYCLEKSCTIRCAKCQIAHYCSSYCQQQNLSEHKKACDAMPPAMKEAWEAIK